MRKNVYLVAMCAAVFAEKYAVQSAAFTLTLHEHDTGYYDVHQFNTTHLNDCVFFFFYVFAREFRLHPDRQMHVFFCGLVRVAMEKN